MSFKEKLIEFLKPTLATKITLGILITYSIIFILVSDSLLDLLWLQNSELLILFTPLIVLLIPSYILIAMAEATFSLSLSEPTIVSIATILSLPIYYVVASVISLITKSKYSKHILIPLFVFVFFFAGVDFVLVNQFSEPDMSCEVDIDCVRKSNGIDSGGCVNKEWSRYEPLIHIASALDIRPTPFPCECEENMCQTQHTRTLLDCELPVNHERFGKIITENNVTKDMQLTRYDFNSDINTSKQRFNDLSSKPEIDENNCFSTPYHSNERSICFFIEETQHQITYQCISLEEENIIRYYENNSITVNDQEAKHYNLYLTKNS